MIPRWTPSNTLKQHLDDTNAIPKIKQQKKNTNIRTWPPKDDSYDYDPAANTNKVKHYLNYYTTK